MTDLMMNKTRHCPYCPVAAGDDNFMWQHISDHLENQHKNPQFKPVPLPTHVVPRTVAAVPMEKTTVEPFKNEAEDIIVGKQVPITSQVDAVKEKVSVEAHEKAAILAKEHYAGSASSSGDISTEKLLTEDGKSNNKSDEVGDKISADELLNNELCDEEMSTEKLLSNYLNAKELTTEELLNKDLIGEEITSNKLSNKKDGNSEEVSDEQLLNNEFSGREFTDEELLNLHVNDEEISNEDLLNNDLSEVEKEESVINSPNKNDGQNSIPCGETSNNEAETEVITSNVADIVNDNEERSSKRKAKKPRKSAPKHINDVLSNPESNQEMAADDSSNAASIEKEAEDTSTSEVDAEAQIKQEVDIQVDQKVEVKKKSKTRGKRKNQKNNSDAEIEQKVEIEVKREVDMDVKKKDVKLEMEVKQKVEMEVKQKVEIEVKQKVEMEVKQKVEIEVKRKVEIEVKRKVYMEVKRKVDMEVKREVNMESDADTSRNDEEGELSLKENTSIVFKLAYMSNPTPDQIKKCISPQYKCPVCSEIHQDFGGHVSLSHGLVRCGRDRACNMFFANMEERRKHEEFVHGTANTPTTWKIICGHCKDVKFPDIYTVVEHRHSLHSFHTCTLCSMITTKDEYYQIHMKSHSIRNASILNLKEGKSLLENLLTYPIATLNQDTLSATCNLCSPGLQAHFDVRGGGDKLWDHFKTGHKVKNPAEALLRLFNGKQFHFRTLLNDKQRLRQLEEAAKETEEAAAKEAEAVAAKEREAAAKKLEAAEKEREAAAARKREAEAKEREAIAKKMEAAANEKAAAAARKREAEAKEREAAVKAEAASKEKDIAAAKKEEADAKERESAIKKIEAASKEREAAAKVSKSNRKSVAPVKQVNSKAQSDASKVNSKAQSDASKIMKNVVLGSSVSIQLKSKVKTKQAEIKNIGNNEGNSSKNDNKINLKTSPVKIKPEPEQTEVIAVKVVENKSKRKRTITKKISSASSSNVSYSSLDVKKELLSEDSKEIKTEGGNNSKVTEEPKRPEAIGGLVEASSDTHSPEASLATIFIKAGSPYTCEVCKDQFTDNGDHLCFQHGMLKCASAKNCQAFFGASLEKEKHEKEAHVDTFSCMPCKMKFNNVYSQLEHRNSGHSQLTCMFCFVGFKCQEKEFSYFKSHMKTHKIAPSLLNDNDERSLFEKLLGEPIVHFNKETMSVSCNLCVKTQSFSGVMSVKEGGNQLWEHFKVIHKIKNSNEMLHLFNGSGFSFSNRKLKYSAKLETFVNKEATIGPAKTNKSQMKSDQKCIVKEETSDLKISSPETLDIKEKGTKKKRGRPKVVYEKEEEIPLIQVQPEQVLQKLKKEGGRAKSFPHKVKEEPTLERKEKIASGKLEHDQGLDDLYGRPPAKKSRSHSNIKLGEVVQGGKSSEKEKVVKKEEIDYEVGLKEELPVEQFQQEQVMAAIDDLEEELKPKKKRQRRSKTIPLANVEEEGEKKESLAEKVLDDSIDKAAPKKKRGRRAKVVPIKKVNEVVSSKLHQTIEMMDDLEENDDLKLQISKLAERQKAYEETSNTDEETIEEQVHNTTDEEAHHITLENELDLNTAEPYEGLHYNTEEATAEPAYHNDGYVDETRSTDINDSEALNTDDPCDIEASEDHPQNIDNGHEELPQDKDESYEELDPNIDDTIEEFAYGTKEAGEEPADNNLGDGEEPAYNADEEPAYNTDDANEEPTFNTDAAAEEPPYKTAEDDDEQAYNSDEADNEPVYNTGDADVEPAYNSDNADKEPAYNSDNADEEPAYNTDNEAADSMDDGDEEPTYSNADDGDEEPTSNNADDGDEEPTYGNADDGDEEPAYSNTDNGDEDPAYNSDSNEENE